MYTIDRKKNYITISIIIKFKRLKNLWKEKIFFKNAIHSRGKTRLILHHRGLINSENIGHVTLRNGTNHVFTLSTVK